ncbi:MAG: DMT family transporter [Paracoccaceae bacterium]
MTRFQANAMLLGAGAIWGMGFVAQSTAMEDLPPFVFLTLRFIIAFLVILPFAIFEARKSEVKLKISEWNAFLIIGVFLFGGMSAQQVGLLTTTVTNSGFLTGLYVVFTPILGVILFRAWPHPIVWPAACIAMVGIFFLAGGQLHGLVIGDWFTILCALCWALQVLFIARWVGASGRPITLAVTQFAICAVLAFIFAASFEQFTWAAVTPAIPELIFTGVFSSGVAFTLQAVGQQHTTAPQAAIFLSSETLFAALFAALILSERLGMAAIAGCLLIFAAMLITELGPIVQMRRRLKLTT